MQPFHIRQSRHCLPPPHPAGIISWNQVVYGNARTAPDGTITCQHGAQECLFNKLQDCGIAHARSAAQWLPFTHCLSAAGSGQQQAAQKCATAAGLDWNAVNTCWQGPEGVKLHLLAGEETSTLQPPHTWVPWATANGVNFCLESGESLQMRCACVVCCAR